MANFIDLMKANYSIEGKEKHWYYSLPYYFQVTLKSGESWKVYLPINPSNISIQTHMATNIVTTLNGVVEEHSDVRFHDITIQGTTGYMPQNYNARQGGDASKASGFMDKVKSIGSELANKVLPGDNNKGPIKPGRQGVDGNESSLSSVVSEVSAVFPKVTGIISQAASLWSGSKDIRKGVDINASGYVAFHNLQRALLAYKKDTSSTKSTKSDSKSGADALYRKGTSLLKDLTGGSAKEGSHPIQFVNLKDNMKYDCAPVQFNVTRSAESPMLYNYSLTFRAYNLRSADDTGKVSTQSADQLDALGLSGYGNSITKSMKSLVGKGMSTFGAIRSLGR